MCPTGRPAVAARRVAWAASPAGLQAVAAPAAAGERSRAARPVVVAQVGEADVFPMWDV